jgi:hypothetical protein
VVDIEIVGKLVQRKGAMDANVVRITSAVQNLLKK